MPISNEVNNVFKVDKRDLNLILHYLPEGKLDGYYVNLDNKRLNEDKSHLLLKR